MDQQICPACNNQVLKCIYKNIYKNKRLFHCMNCGLYFIWPKISCEENIGRYTQEYYDSPWALRDLGDAGLTEMKSKTFSRILDTIESYRGKDTLLDVGCAFGHLLGVAKERGWDTYGSDVSDYAIQKTAELIGADKVWLGDFLNLSIPKNRFSVITMVDFIEHTYNINVALKKSKELLKDKGLLIIVTPDIDSLSRRLLRRYWPHFNEHHVIFLSRNSAAKILKINGFRLLEISNFKKALNFSYMRLMIRAYGKKPLVLLMEILNIMIPATFKKRNNFMSHGEMLVISEKE